MDKKRIDIMVDIETLGKEGNSPVIQVAAAAFDIHTGEILKEFNRCCDISYNKNLIVDGSTLKWWLETDSELLKTILARGSVDGTEQYVIEMFHRWITNLQEDYEVYLWGNGILFDNRIIKEKFEAFGLQYPIFYRNDRDLRTIVDIVNSKYNIDIRKECEVEGERKHDAMNYVVYHIRVATRGWNMLM